MKFAFILAEKAYFPIAFMCRHLGVSTSGLHGGVGRRARMTSRTSG